jgi:hypothetical protein
MKIRGKGNGGVIFTAVVYKCITMEEIMLMNNSGIYIAKMM